MSECTYLEEETNTVPGIFIFKTNHMLSGDRLRLLRNDLLDQMKSGIILLPPYVDFIFAIPKDCKKWIKREEVLINGYFNDSFNDFGRLYCGL